MKHLSGFALLIVLYAVVLQGWAQQQLAAPLRLVASDSVLVWLNDPANIVASAQQTDRYVAEQPFQAVKLSRKEFKQRCDQWNQTLSDWMGNGYACSHHQPSVVDMVNGISASAHLFCVTADSRYLNAIERVAYNHLLPIVVPPADLSFERRMAAQTLMNIGGMIYATDEEGAYVNFYLNNTAHIKTDTHDFIIDQMTAMPYEGLVKLRVSGLKRGRTPITLRFRMPDWALRTTSERAPFAFLAPSLSLPTIYVNGRDEQLPVVNGYVEVCRLWNNGDEVYFILPTDFFKVCGKCEDKSCMALQRGPLVYGFCDASAPSALPLPQDVYPTDSLNQYGHPYYSVKGTHHRMQPLLDGGVTVCIKR